MINQGLFTSNTDLWATPQSFFDKLHDEFGFEVDVCANHENAKCPVFFTKEQDGLQQNWNDKTCWMNPPYGREIKSWVKKASDARGVVVVCLLPARTDTSWFHDYIYNNWWVEIRFVRGRLKFGDATNSAPFPSMIVIFYGKQKQLHDIQNEHPQG